MQHMLHCCLSKLLMSCFRVLALPENGEDKMKKKRAYQLELDRQVRTLSVQRYYAALTTSVMDVMRSLQFVSPYERFKNFAPVVPKVLPALTEVATDMWAVG